MDRFDIAFNHSLAEIKSRYPDEDHMSEIEKDAYAHEVYEAYTSTLPKSKEEWLEHYGPSFKCLTCEHFKSLFDNGMVYCSDISVYLPAGLGRTAERKTWTIRSPCKTCSDYKKTRGQTRLAIDA